jgi:hypothetical protein
VQATGTAVRRCFAAAVCGAALAAFASPAHADERFTLRATAGLAGFVMAGRAAPIALEIEHHGSSADAVAEVVIRWGDAVVRRRVFMGSTRTRRVEVVARTNEPAGIVRVGISGQSDVLDLPVTVLPHTTRVTLCVSQPDGLVAEPARCSMTIEPGRLPRSTYAYEIVTNAVVSDGARIPEPARLALARWLSIVRLETSGDLSLTPQVTRPVVERGLPGDTATVLRIGSWLYVALLLSVGVLIATTRFTALTAWIASIAVVTTVTGAAWMLGSRGPASQITVHHRSLLQQIPGAGGAMVSMRGVTEFPSDGLVLLRMAAEDGSLEVATSEGRTEQSIDEHGVPQIVTRAGLGSRHAWTGEAVTHARWVAVEEVDRTVTITNETSFPLVDCRFADGMSVTDVGVLAPGAVTTAVRDGDIVGPLFSCNAAHPVLTLTADPTAVAMHGTTTVVVYRDRANVALDEEAPND